MTTSLISFISYSLVATISIVIGLIYLLKHQFMPYHSKALGLSWSELEANMQVLIIALMRATGGGLVASGIAMLVLLLIPWKRGDTWSLYAIPAINLCVAIGSLYAMLLVKNKTPGTPPVILSLLAIVLTLVGFILSII